MPLSSQGFGIVATFTEAFDYLGLDDHERVDDLDYHCRYLVRSLLYGPSNLLPSPCVSRCGNAKT